MISVEIMKTIDESERCDARCDESVIKTAKDTDN